MIESFLQDIKGWFAALPYIAVLFAIGTTGFWLRQGVETKKVLQKAKQDALRKGMVVNQKWHDLYSKANQKIGGGVIILWVILFGAIILIFPYYLLIASGAWLVSVALGYFGIRIVPEGFGDD